MATELVWAYVSDMDICSLRRLPVFWRIKQHKAMGGKPCQRKWREKRMREEKKIEEIEDLQTAKYDSEAEEATWRKKSSWNHWTKKWEKERKALWMENYWTQYPAFCPLQRNKCWPYFLPGLSGAVWLNKSSPAALSRSLSINIFISLFNYLKHFLCSIYFTQMEVGWAAPPLSKTCTAGASRNIGHKVLLGSSPSTTFTLAPWHEILSYLHLTHLA